MLVCAIPLKVLIKEKNRCPVSEILFRQAAKPAQLSSGLAVSEVGWLDDFLPTAQLVLLLRVVTMKNSGTLHIFLGGWLFFRYILL